VLKKTYYLAALLLIAGCARSDATYKAERYTLGTYVQVELIGKKKHAQNFLQAFDQLTEQQTKDLYAWGNGELAAINQYLKQAQCTPVPLSASMLSLLLHSKKMSEKTSSLFSPSIKPLVELWGFHRTEEMRSSPPRNVDIQTTLNRYGNMQDLRIRAKTVCANKPLELDLGGIAKGWAAFTAAKQLHNNHIENALIGFGGDLIALGSRHDGTPWKVGLKNPNINWEGFDAPAVFEIESDNDNAINTTTAIFTSGDYERQFEHYSF